MIQNLYRTLSKAIELDERTDWAGLAAFADVHGLAPLAYRGLNSSTVAPARAEGFHELRKSYVESARRSAFLTLRLLALVERFQTAQIRVLAIKGPMLAEALYEDPGVRPYLDLDLLVRRQEAPAALRLLREQGYRIGSAFASLPEDKLIDLSAEVTLRRGCGTQVDLHWEIAPSDYPFRFDSDILWSSLETVRIGQRDIPTLSSECLLLYLCVHGAKHLWARLIWLCDVARLMDKGLEWRLTLELAQRAHCVRPVLLGVWLAHDLLQGTAPAEVLRLAGADPTIPSLAAEVKDRLSLVPPRNPTSLELVRFNAKMADSARAKVRHYAALLKAPTEAEATLVQLPPALFLLYYPIRLGRLALKYTACLLGH